MLEPESSSTAATQGKCLLRRLRLGLETPLLRSRHFCLGLGVITGIHQDSILGPLLLWLPCVADADITFCPVVSSFFLLSFFFFLA